MHKRNKIKAIVSIAVALAFVTPGVTAVANFGTFGITPNSENTDNIKNIEEVITSDNSDSSDTEVIKENGKETDDHNLEEPYDCLEEPCINCESEREPRVKEHRVPLAPLKVKLTNNILTRGTIYVDDDADPTWYDETHVKTIQEGVDNASAEDTVYVYNGTYRERVTVTKQLDLIGESRENVIIDGSGSGNIVKVTASGVSIDTFTIINGSYGIYLYKPSNNNIIINCDAYNNTNYGIYVSYSSDNNITNCNTYNNKYGIKAYKGSDNNITSCDVYNNSDYGIYFSESPTSTIINCDVYNNIKYYGLYIYKSSGCELKDNTIHDNAYNFAVEGTSVNDFNQDIDISNMVNGKPIYYLIDHENITLDGTTDNFGYLGMISCTNMTAKNSDVSGIIMIDTTDSTISNVDSHNSRNGIYLYLSSDNNNIINCDAYNNKYNGGIYIRESSNNNITNCDVYNNIKYGIYIYKNSNDNNITNCNAYNNNNHGIYVYTSSNNNVIMDCTSYNSTKDGIRVYNSLNNNIINCDAYNNSLYGFYLYKYSDSNITNCNAYNNKNGIYVTSSENAIIINCTSYNNSVNGIYLKSLNSKIIDCAAYNNTENGIRIYKYKTAGDNNIIINCDAYNNNEYGIYIYKSSSNNIINCDTYGNNDYGLYLYQSLNNNLDGNAIHDNVYNFAVDGTIISQFHHVISPSNTVNGKPLYYFVDQENISLDGTTDNFGYLALISCTNMTAKNADVNGVLVLDTTDSTIFNVDSHNSINGIYLWMSSGNSILNCSVYDNNENGIYLYQPSNNNNIINCNVYNNNEIGIDVSYSSNNDITNCNVYNNQHGIYLYRSPNNNNITNCSAYNNNEIGIYLYEASNNNILNCDAYNNSEHGIDLSQSSNDNDITNCDVYNNKEYGIRFWVAKNIKFRDNTIHDNTYDFGIKYGGIDYFYHDIDTSNKINGKPMYYLIEKSNGTLDGTTDNFGYLALISCTNMTAQNVDVSGVLIANTTDSTISNVNSHNSAYGIYLWDSSDNDIINCDAYDNEHGGIYFYLSSNNNIENCDLYSNSYGTYLNNAANNITNCALYDNNYGIYLSSSSDSNITGCKLYSNIKNGIRFYISSNNNIVNCNIYNNIEEGIYLVSISNDNSIHHNNFVNNGENAYDKCSNMWDDGSEGNYWDDYTGVDVDPKDGIGDTPYNITGGSNQDQYPLMIPWDETPPVITDVQATPEVQKPDELVNITCTVTDNWDMIDMIKINISGPDGFALEVTMSEGSYYYEDTYATIGVYYYYIWANDTQGNIATSDTYTFVITDLTTPTSAVDPLSTWNTVIPFTVTVIAYDDTGVANVTLWSRYSTNGTDWTEWTSYGIDEEDPWIWSFTGSDGYYEFYSIAVDDFGNVENAPDIADALTGIDTVPPVTSIELDGTMGGDGWYTSGVKVTFSSTDALSGVASTWYQIDSGNWKFYTAPFMVNGEGQHTVKYYSFDMAGNKEDTKSVDLKIDMTTPTTTHKLEGFIGEDGWFVTNVTVTLSAEDVLSGVNYTTYTLNDGAWIVYEDSFVVTENGEYTLCYYSVDLAGNIETTKEVAFKIDHDVLPPVTTHNFDGIIGDNDWFISDVTVTLGAADFSPSGVNHTYYKLDDDVEWQEYTSAFSVTDDAVHILYYYSVDYIGNKEPVNEAIFKIDQTVPTIVLTAEKTGLTKWVLNATVSDNTSGVAKVEFYLTGELLGEVTEPPYEWTVSNPKKDDKAQAIVYDNAGNLKVSAEVTPQSQSQSQSSSSTLVQSITLSNPEPELDVGRVWLRGLLWRCNRVGNVNHAMAIRLHYIEFTGTERTLGTVTMNNVVFEDSAYGGHMYEIGAGLFTYVIGFFEGGLEIL